MKKDEVIYKKVQKTVDSEKIECDICTNEDELYHLTSVENLQSIVKSRKLEPSGHSKSVSLSANPDHTFGGRVKLTLDHKKVNTIQPMCYFTHGTPASHAYYKAEGKHKEESRSLDDIRSEVGMQPDVYKNECEWYSRKPVDIPEDAIKKIEYFITWTTSSQRVDCRGHIPAHVYLRGDDEYKELLSQIAKVRETAKKIEVPFQVNSCFPFIKSGWYEYIKLDEENLARLTRGENPIITHEEPPEECREIRGCRRASPD